MDRRKFLAKSTVAGGALLVPPAFDTWWQQSRAAESPDLVMTKGGAPGSAAKEAVAALGGMARFVSRGDIVVIKPNIAFDRRPEQAATTNPEVVKAVAEMCLEAGARLVKVFDRPVNDARRCYVQSGIAAALEPMEGVELKYVDERRFRDMRIGGQVLTTWPIYTEAVEADVLINIPIAKHHGLARLTMTIKNWMGIMGGNRSRIHQRLDQALAEMAAFVQPALSILDAHRILVANGPQGGSLDDVRHPEVIIAGTDEVAIDSLGATLFDMTGSDLGYVREAVKLGVGEADLNKLKVQEIALAA
ncbi:DUF362 domain-containing protein [Desulfurivibrio dismutans]|uniref:DUF362 domain-containing protein n=1 Tax=Desulfurivibrio dismutans TaxID=1398908 RepID=UPI0023DAAE8A|nr:DUF362 domain-containing protein [Desulfurivibrio alkaliphilus]MDF1614976.1 DUF362 domain-containing protein [Desulfurivibrio alkaliphilus]